MLKIIDVAALYGTYRIMKCNDNGSTRIVFGLFVEGGNEKKCCEGPMDRWEIWENYYYIRI